MESTGAEVENCLTCGCSMDVSILAPFTNVQCPECGEHKRVKCLLGSYELKRRQGVGGMSLVFGAVDRTLGREVAIKILNEAYSMDEKRIAQFEQEAQITAGISHPHVVRVYTVGQAHGRFFIAMEMVAGDSLEKRMAERGALDESDVVTLSIQVTEGLQAAHRAGLIHRDIKPGNILFDNNDHAKIVDFGLALMTQGGVAKADEIWATPYYVPPEALDGLDEDFRSDIYALGASLYHAISGKPPFEQETKSTGTLKEIKRGLSPLKKAAPWVSDGLCVVIDKAMAFNPDDRFQSYEEMLYALKHLDAMGAQLGMEHMSARSKRRAQSGNFLFVYIGIAAVALAVGGFFVYSLTQKEEVEDDIGDKVVDDTSNVVDQRISDAKSQLIAAEVRSFRNLMKRGNYKAASNILLNLTGDDEVPTETVYWAGLHSAITSMLDGRSGSARKALREIQRRQTKDEGTKSYMDKKLERASDSLIKLKPINASDLDRVEDELDMLILFAAALKNWEQGVWKNAEALFKRFEEVTKDGESEEILIYRGLVSDYLHDMHLVESFSEDFKPLTPQEGEIRRSEIGEMALRLKTRGRAVYNAAALQNQMSMRIRALESKLMRDERPVKLEKISEFDAMKLEVGNLTDDCKFGEALELLINYETEVESELEWKHQMVYMTEKGAQFLETMFEDLSAKLSKFPVKSRDGEVTYQRVEGVRKEGLEVMSEGSKKLLLWGQLDPNSILNLHRKLSEGIEDAGAPRLEQAIAYAWLLGLRDKAGTAAAKLSVKDELFKKRWLVIIEVLE